MKTFYFYRSLRQAVTGVVFIFLAIASAVQAKTNPLVGRWELINPAADANSSFNDFVVFQFEASGTLYVERGENARIQVFAVPYSVSEDSLSIPYYLDDSSIAFSTDGDSLSLSLPDGEILELELQDEQRTYASIATGGDMRLLPIDQVDIDVEIVGTRAITNAIYTIKNNYDEDIEASFELPLPEGAIVIGYALDIQGELVEGVAVPKAKAREVFEEIEDQKTDPGIAEIARGNRFTTEIYPVPANGVRRVSVRYIQPLQRTLRGFYEYQFLMQQIDSTAAINMALKVDRVEREPRVKDSPFQNVVWEKATIGSRYYAADALVFSSRRLEEHEDFTLHVDPQDKQGMIYASGQDNKNYFSTQFVIDESLLSKLDGPKDITILWDVSASMAESHKENYKILLQYLKNLMKSEDAPASLNCVFFANDVLLQQEFELDKDGYKSLAAILKNAIYDGATQFSSLADYLTSDQTSYAVLFSDGVSSLGSLSSLKSEVPVYIISDGDETDYPWLYQLAETSDGLLLNSNNVNRKRMVELIGMQLPKFDLKLNGEIADEHVYQTINIDDEIVLNVVGKIDKNRQDNNHLILSVLNDGDEIYKDQVSLWHGYGRALRYDWLRTKLNSLLGDIVANEEAIKTLGMENTLVTPFTSLMVLEDIEDYAFYGIEPPGNFPQAGKYKQLRKEFLAGEEEYSREDLLADLRRGWQERVSWWEASTKMQTEDAVRLFKAKKEKQGLETEVNEVIVAGIRASLAEPGKTTELIPWSPDKPYIQELLSLEVQDESGLYKLYLKQRKEFGASPAFYMDVAQLFINKGYRTRAVRIISNILELNPENVELERIVAYNLVEFGELDAAITVFEHVKKLNAWEATSYRDLALAWEKKARASNQLSHFQSAIEYYNLAITKLDTDDDELRIVALMELNHLLHYLQEREIEKPDLPGELIRNLDTDIRIVLSWNSRVADVDLWVEEPSGELVSYENPESVAKGYLPYDDTDGFGPEEYLARFAMAGEYTVKVNLFANNSVELFGPVILTLDVYTDFGKETENRQTTTVRLETTGEEIEIGKVTYH